MRRIWVREISGWLAALLIAITAVAQLASTARSELLLRDADSLVVPLLVRSAFDGEPFAWIMSSVLFLPEILLLGLLWVVGRVLALDVNAVLLLNAVINLVALYGAIRFAAGRRREGSAPIGWSIAARVSLPTPSVCTLEACSASVTS